MKILHFVDGAPDAEQSRAACTARANGDDYKFVSETWALSADKLECDKVVTDNDELIAKYGKKNVIVPVEIEEEQAEEK